MRKTIALLLVLLTIFSLTACGDKKKKADSESQPQVTEATTPAPVVDMTPHVIEGKQEFWVQVFKKSTIQTASDSFVMTMADLTIKAQRDKNGNMFVGYHGINNSKDMPMGVYISKNKEGYVNTRYTDTLDEYPNETSQWFEVNTWTSITFDTEADKKALSTFLQNIQNELVPVNELLQTIERIEYIHTINGQDYIKGYYTEIDKENSPALIPTKGASVRVYGLFECMVENEPLQFIYLEENVDGDIESYTHLLNTKKDLWYSYDADNKMMTIDGTKYRCTMVVDYSKKELPVIEHCIDFVMEPKTQSVYSVEGVLRGYKLSVEFTECDKAYDVMDLPFFTEEKIPFTQVSEDCPQALAGAIGMAILQQKL